MNRSIQTPPIAFVQTNTKMDRVWSGPVEASSQPSPSHPASLPRQNRNDARNKRQAGSGSNDPVFEKPWLQMMAKACVEQS